MKIIAVKTLFFPEIKLIRFHRFSDDRGYFTETFRQSDLQKIIPEFQVKQINESVSKKGVFRGLHFQWNPYMGKLIRVISGQIIDFFLDIRVKSANFGKIAGYKLTGDFISNDNTWIWVPVGFAHGICTLEPSTIEYLCTGEYNPNCEASISPLASDIDWSVCDPAVCQQFADVKKTGLIISAKDQQGLSVKQWQNDPRSKFFDKT